MFEGQADQWEKPFWSQVWDELFDAGGFEEGLHHPEALGRILQEELGFPRRPNPPSAGTGQAP